MVEIDIAYEGQLRCSAVHLPSASRLETDAPVDNQGRGETFSPTDLVATALGSCLLTIMGIFAERHDLDLSGAKVRVTKHMVADPRRRIGKLEVLITVAGDFSRSQRRALEKVAATCPVHVSLGEGIEQVIRFQWDSAS
jgi:putative redox protein